MNYTVNACIVWCETIFLIKWNYKTHKRQSWSGLHFLTICNHRKSIPSCFIIFVLLSGEGTVTSACSHIQIDHCPRRRAVLKQGMTEGGIYLRNLSTGGISHLPTLDFERDRSLGWIYLKVGQQPQRKATASWVRRRPRFPSPFKCRLFLAVNHTNVFIIDFQMIGFYITGLGSTALHSWIYIMPKE